MINYSLKIPQNSFHTLPMFSGIGLGALLH